MDGIFVSKHCKNRRHCLVRRIDGTYTVLIHFIGEMLFLHPPQEVNQRVDVDSAHNRVVNLEGSK